MNTFQSIKDFAKLANKMPIPYTDFKGRKYTTVYTTEELLSKVVLGVESHKDDSVEATYRDLEKSCLSELGFIHIALFISKNTNESIAILGI